MALDPITAGIGLLDTFIGKFVADKDLAAKLAIQARSEEFQGDITLLTGQMAVNQEEAKSTNWFVAGWRPWIGWICGAGLAYAVLIEPLARFIAQVGFHYAGPFPVIDTTLTMQVLIGMLGLGTMRTWEKTKGGEGHR
jgi:hypothetical protein